MKRILITGATQGLGLQIVKKLIKKPDVSVIMAVRNIEKGNEIASALGPRVSVMKLDLSSLANVEDFISHWDTPIDGLINNAGVQFNRKNSFTADGYEETIAVNHLASFLLTLGLKDYLSNGRVLFIGSGTHDPGHPVAKRFGFRGARYTSVKELSLGKGETSDIIQQNKDRYSTSKFLNTITAVELARRFKHFSSFVLDPGLMPGTGLMRQQSGIIRFILKWLMPAVGLFLPDTSSPARSAAAASWIMTDTMTYPSGTVFSYSRKPGKHVWGKMVYDEDIGKQVFDDTLDILKRYLPRN